jgi:kynureninase
MVSFYRPTKTRYKIICEEKAFPSDQYMFQSQVQFHGYQPEDAIIEIKRREGEHNIRLEDVLAKINEVGDELALVLIGGVNYYTGQVFDMKTITEAGHQVGAQVGWDLAHAAGNIKLELHDWNVDFACWCSYKYLNSGPGGVSGVYIHEKHSTNTDLQRFAGWWGYEKDTRFKMDRGFKAIPTAEGWQLSNAPILSMAAHKAALDVIEEAGMDRLHKKRKALNNFLWFIVDEINKAKNVFEIITPRNEAEHGCQISLLTGANGKNIFDELTKQGIITDWREPNVIRIAPVPLYNSFEDIWKFGDAVSRITN